MCNQIAILSKYCNLPRTQIQPPYAPYSLFKRTAIEQVREKVLTAAVSHALFRHSIQRIDIKL
jgi:hypothetical protein